MGELYSFKDFQLKKEKRVDDPRIIVAIYQSVVYYVHLYIDATFEHPLEHLTTNVDLATVFHHDRSKFTEALAVLRQHWNISHEDHLDLCEHDVFARFPTVGDLCMYIEKKVKDP